MVGSPHSVFLLVGSRAKAAELITCSTVTFCFERIKAEEEARQAKGGEEVTLDEIYSCLAKNLDFIPTVTKELRSLELLIESQILFPVPRARELVASARCQGFAVVFVSDMYLPSVFLRRQLSTFDLCREEDRVYVSCEELTSKYRGQLFQNVFKREGVHPKQCFHIGDNSRGDVAVPLKLGAQVQSFQDCALNRFEQLLEEASSESEGFSSLLAGVSRKLRLDGKVADAHQVTLRHIASSVIAPVLFGYGLWLIREAKQRGIRRLYFVARDGYLIKKAVDALLSVSGASIETRYLYGSRQAWHLPAITDFSEASLSWLFEKTRILTLRIVLSRVQIDPEDIADILLECGLARASWDECLAESDLSVLQRDLLSNEQFVSYLRASAGKKRSIALAYLAQEGLFDGVPSCTVDLGWHGRLQRSLETLLCLKSKAVTTGMYFGLFLNSPALKTLQTSAYFEWDLQTPSSGNEIPSLVFLMESFCTAPHGSTVGYVNSADGSILPLLREHNCEQLKKWGLSVVHSTFDEFCALIKGSMFPPSAFAWDSRGVVVSLLKTFSSDPSPAEARAWGSFPYEDDQAGVRHELLTQAYEINYLNLKCALTFGEENRIPSSQAILWRGAQKHMRSYRNVIMQLLLWCGRRKRQIGASVRFVMEAVRVSSKKRNLPLESSL